MQAIASKLEQKGAKLQEELTSAMVNGWADEEQKIQRQLEEENRQAQQTFRQVLNSMPLS